MDVQKIFRQVLDNIKTFDDCKKAGFKVIKANPDICQVGEPYMTGGKYKTLTNFIQWKSTKLVPIIPMVIILVLVLQNVYQALVANQMKMER